MNKDKTRFLSANELAQELGCDTNTAIEYAAKADAVMRIGSKVWYDRDKTKEYQQKNEKPKIQWLTVGNGGKFNENDSDVTITIIKPSKEHENPRLRIVIKKDAIESIKLGKKIMLGLAEDRLYMTFSDTDGYAVCNQKATVVTTLSCREGIEKFKGNHTLFRCADDLLFVRIGE